MEITGAVLVTILIMATARAGCGLRVCGGVSLPRFSSAVAVFFLWCFLPEVSPRASCLRCFPSRVFPPVFLFRRFPFCVSLVLSPMLFPLCFFFLMSVSPLLCFPFPCFPSGVLQSYFPFPCFRSGVSSLVFPSGVSPLVFALRCCSLTFALWLTPSASSSSHVSHTFSLKHSEVSP